MNDAAPPPPHQPLWSQDRGMLAENSRRALLELLRGPYLSGARRPQLWAALVADESVLRSRLHDLFLDLVIDHEYEFAFTRKVETDDLDVPAALRSETLTFLDTAMLLVLRQLLLAAAGEHRVIVSRDDVAEQLAVYRQHSDESTWTKRVNSSWQKMLTRFLVLQKVEEDRAEISPVLRLMVDSKTAAAFTELYTSLAEPSADEAQEDEFGPGSADAEAADATGPDAAKEGRA